jgi:hypothetical protein
VIPAAILFVVLILIAFFIVMGDLISDWIDETIWGVVNRREYRRITRANPHLRPETLEQMTRRAWEEYQRRAVS